MVRNKLQVWERANFVKLFFVNVGSIYHIYDSQINGS